MILALRTDSFDTEIYLTDSKGSEIDSYSWHAGRELSVELLTKISTLLKKHKVTLNDVDGIVVYRGPGSFTGLRIGVAVANALAYGCDIPVAGSSGEEWIVNGVSQLDIIETYTPVHPEYGSDPHITQPRK